MHINLGSIHFDDGIYVTEGEIDGAPIHIEGRFAEEGDDFEGFRVDSCGSGASDGAPWIPASPPAGWRDAEALFRAECEQMARSAMVSS